jgi:hypothetical protein
VGRGASLESNPEDTRSFHRQPAAQSDDEIILFDSIATEMIAFRPVTNPGGCCLREWLAFDFWGPYLGFPESHGVYGDGSIVVVRARGHTPGGRDYIRDAAQRNALKAGATATRQTSTAW